ncbi:MULTISPECIES: MmgE/PrpD family protein [unclassified Cupriavidus]|uniref:MmgE/PrpD family protein n=1 Tax=unclassified Cupriavidus TaxID=2640874 RepID=UPI001C00282A|nr:MULTISPECIES: MmgE/PrpD family protein [unclassified Cupriavidus]MCA3185305.1 MmgE/PrpD family protein [Cupriavidus sp.]MCA3189109.1 MmgE/PrpD family protein [Cupriavidus sp.]MCA3198829.1 MmgE/PrpD family protein [Cupriavidus sp.]MCA3201573.1 MmgE/PrpD family protein [Cupriavidus sp.]MCA3233459.1 MmgE/PrpD family protein [Cupriavidus sp.]
MQIHLTDIENAATRIATFACDFRPTRLTDTDLDLCGRSLADTYAVAVAGRGEHAPLAALAYLSRAGLLHNHAGQGASLWGRTERAAPEIAAWWNGIAGHVLDYDDVTVPMRGHPSVVLWPALLALAEDRGLMGDRLSSAFTVGMEVIGKLSRAMALPHYAAGWHSTATIGALGAAVACCHLLDLNASQIVHAIGIAVAQAAGTRENVGSEGKSFQAGHANAVAVRAASLAEAGFEAGPGALDGPNGFLALYAGDDAPHDWLAGLGEAPLELRRSGLDVKQYPMCYATHRALDAVLALRASHDIRLADVERVEITTSHGALVPLVHPNPRTGLEGKFSMPYAMAAALKDGAIRLTSFVDASVQRPDIQAFFPRVRATESAGPATPRWAEITITLRDGRQLHQRVQTLRGSAQQPMDAAELAAKLDDCLAWTGVAARGPELLALAQQCHARPARALITDLQAIVASAVKETA